ncbi:MAG: elongation factor G [Bacteroidetes bacterium GWF2_42_66]|nr:MAG: elongation factor G [Bacteroidetes bacterium GWA2_42_15]OFY01004.1 MAG: elongation factor G [Bacteroidetes bacterium GWE2_42_39]OFY41844.1 MAG: elongation factor G [Bacteroidetes bacterium GWF2_42_66]HBL77982.1 elongation factor G [Prolixibacteraceae bacterium]HCR90254.1 elongation factor G [Prolixibacteraceae bacterium]
MRIYKTDQIRNITLIGNSGSGKTTLAEAMLFEGGVINRRGDIVHKNTVSDYQIIEQEYQNSVYSTLLYTEYNDKKINILDTPGMDDFCGGVVSSLEVTGLGIMLLSASNGIEAGTESAARHAEKKKTPLVFVVNQLDHENANFEQAVEQAKAYFGNKVTVVQYPVDAGPGFSSIVDVLKMKLYKYGPEGGKPEVLDIPASEKDKAEELHNQLIEMAAENEESLMELYFDQGSLSEDDMRKGMKIGMMQRDFFPVFCTCAKKNIGVNRLLEFICNIAPAPSEIAMRPIVNGKQVVMDEKQPVSLFVFKTSVESHVGEITYFKVMSGKLTEGKDLINSHNGNKERISQIFAVAGKNRASVTELYAGDLGCSVKLKETKFNQTLGEKELDIKFAPIVFPDPKYRVAVKALNESDDEKVGEIIHRIRFEDPTYLVEYSKELKQLIVEGMGEYHLNTLKWFFDHIHKIDIEYLAPKIPYRETITKFAQAMYRHKKQSGGAGQFGEVHMIIEPYVEGAAPKNVFFFDGKEQKISVRDVQENKMPWGGKLIFCNCIVGGSIDARFLPAILKGIMEKMEEGPLTGSYARDIIVYVYDGKMHPVDSNEISFKLAGRNAFSQAFKIAGPKILEPIYTMEVFTPSERMGDVMSDLQGRRALIMGMGSERGYEKITTRVPLKEMNKYSTSLSSLTGGRGRFTMKFAEYEKVPQDVQDELLAAYAAEQDDE